MARVNVYLPDDLVAAARAAGLNVSRLTQQAIAAALNQTRVDVWLDDARELPDLGIDHSVVIEAVRAARRDLGTPDG